MKRFLFIIQGEGRGHLTQALSLAQLLRAAGHEVAAVLVGRSGGSAAPDFFTEAIDAPVETFSSPGLVYHPRTHALDLKATTRQTIRHLGSYARSIRQIRRAIRTHRPDAVINFYDILGGLTFAWYRPAVPLVCVAHQYLLGHPRFPHPQGWRFDRWLVALNSRLTALGAKQRLALSFTPLPDRPGLTVVPPLLRQELLTRRQGGMPYLSDTAFLLAYVSQDALGQQLLEEHRKHPEVPIHLFKGGVKKAVEPVDATLSHHRIDGTAFLDQMEQCRAVVTTAGFEAVCEAMYLGKPVLLTPMPNHYEQRCNALDAVRAGAGVADFDRFNLKKLLDYLPTHDQRANEAFRHWQSQFPTLFLKALDSVLHQPDSVADFSKKTSEPAVSYPRLALLRQKISLR
ncbi:glycosyltransferase family protein [Tellurirhabdus rosea]|uniref:glycosyltransferase family protein n=1 Tax=Tellurirhabdus rosea TaxID=2674997 RepID=UPI002251C29D|nr:glycosyltransferase family protein [Tellurirhabdus rosea]